MKDELKQNVWSKTSPAPAGASPPRLLKNAPADGSTIMIAPIVVPILAPLVFSKLNYDPQADFAPVAAVANFQFGLSVNAAHPAKTVADWWPGGRPTRRRPTSARRAPGSLPHFFGVMIGRDAGLDLIHVPYNGGGPLMTALMGNQVSSASTRWSTRSNCTAPARSASWPAPAPSVPRCCPRCRPSPKSGLKGVEGSSWFAIYAPAERPRSRCAS